MFVRLAELSEEAMARLVAILWVASVFALTGQAAIVSPRPEKLTVAVPGYHSPTCPVILSVLSAVRSQSNDQDEDRCDDFAVLTTVERLIPTHRLVPVSLSDADAGVCRPFLRPTERGPPVAGSAMSPPTLFSFSRLLVVVAAITKSKGN
jgi:hypothetical protein